MMRCKRKREAKNLLDFHCSLNAAEWQSLSLAGAWSRVSNAAEDRSAHCKN